jgi:16S rRNA (uracil1498-N3)-methyltransferase
MRFTARTLAGRIHLWLESGNFAVPDHDFRTQRLFVDAALSEGADLRLGREQTHYLSGVLRMAIGAPVLVFNGRDGEWLARLSGADRKAATLTLDRLTRPQPAPSALIFAFAPLKHARLDYGVQKAVEMGAGILQPVLTRYTQATRVNLDRMRANVIEAAEQCGVLALPEVRPEIRLDAFLAACPAGHVAVFCDEAAPVKNPIEALRGAAPGPAVVLIGPEGGFSDDERAAILRLPRVVTLSLGPRILRADTAGVAALALVQAVRGDWAEEAAERRR